MSVELERCRLERTKAARRRDPTARKLGKVLVRTGAQAEALAGDPCCYAGVDIVFKVQTLFSEASALVGSGVSFVPSGEIEVQHRRLKNDDVLIEKARD